MVKSECYPEDHQHGNNKHQDKLSEAEIGEIVAHVAINVLTNYFNIAFETEIDFPVIRTQQAKAA